MAKGRRLRTKQINSLLRQIDINTINGKTLSQACKAVATVEQSYYRWCKIYGGMKMNQASKHNNLSWQIPALRNWLPTSSCET